MVTVAELQETRSLVDGVRIALKGMLLSLDKASNRLDAAAILLAKAIPVPTAPAESTARATPAPVRSAPAPSSTVPARPAATPKGEAPNAVPYKRPATKRDAVFDLFASSPLSYKEIAARADTTDGTVSTIITTGRKAKDPRIIEGDRLRAQPNFKRAQADTSAERLAHLRAAAQRIAAERVEPAERGPLIAGNAQPQERRMASSFASMRTDSVVGAPRCALDPGELLRVGNGGRILHCPLLSMYVPAPLGRMMERLACGSIFDHKVLMKVTGLPSPEKVDELADTWFDRLERAGIDLIRVKKIGYRARASED